MPIPRNSETTEAPTTYAERGFTWPMSHQRRERLLDGLPPDMRAVFYEVEMRAREVLGDSYRLENATRATMLMAEAKTDANL